MPFIARDSASGLSLMPAGDLDNAIDFYSWDEMEKVLERFLGTFDADSGDVVWEDPEDRWTGGHLRTVVQLVPRPDNENNPDAISVAAPPVFGGSALARHMGYIPDHVLARYGSNKFQRLTAVGAVGCHAVVHVVQDDATDSCRPSHVSLLLPMPEEFNDLVEAYLSTQPSKDGTSSKSAMHDMLLGDFHAAAAAALAHRALTGEWGRSTPRTRMRERIDNRALRRLAEWADYRSGPAHCSALTVQTRSVFGNRRVHVIDAAGARVAQWHGPTMVTVTDERLREAAYKALAKAEYEVPTIRGGADFPNTHVTPRRDGWRIEAIDSTASVHGPEVIGTYDPSTCVLTVHSTHYKSSLTTLVRRHGVEPERVALRLPPLNEEWVEVARGSAPATYSWELSVDVRDYLPASLARHAPFKWINEKELILTPSARELEEDTYYIREIRTLFGEHRRANRVSYCRLCGAHALGATRSGEMGAQELAYCMGCLRRARRGVFADNGMDSAWMDLATWVIRELAMSELGGGAPSLKQLQTLTSTSEPDQADKAVLLRMLVPRPKKHSEMLPSQQRAPLTWSEWLQRAGLLDGGLKTVRGTVSVAADGHLSRSLLERHIDDFMTANGIRHGVEPNYPHDPALNTTGLRADWLLEDGTLVEAWGLPDDPVYAAKMQRKNSLAESKGLRLVGITAADLVRLPEIFRDWLCT